MATGTKKPRVSPHYRRTTILWKLVDVQVPGGVKSKMWKTVIRSEKGDEVRFMALDQVPEYLALMASQADWLRRKYVFQPYED